MGVPLVIRSTNDLIYNYQLSSAYKSPWVFDPSFALSRDPDVWEIVRNDAVVLSALSRRNQAIVRPWRVEGNKYDKDKGEKSKRLGGMCEEALDNITRFNAARRLLAEAPILSRKYACIYWEEVRCSLDDSPEMDWFLPYMIKDIDRRRFHWASQWDVVGGKARKRDVWLEWFNTEDNLWYRVTPDMRRNLIEYIASDSEDRVGYGRGWIEALYFCNFFKTGTFKKIAEGIDRYANGVLIGRLDSMRNASTGKTNADLLTAMRNVLQDFRSEHVIILQEGDEIEIKEPQGRGFQTAMDFVKYLDECVERLLNGSVRPAGHSVGGTGARAQASVEADQSEAFYQDDREDLDEIIDRDLLGAFLYYNQRNFQKLELDCLSGDCKRPHFTTEQIKRQDPTRSVAIMNQALQAGVPLVKSEYYDRIEMSVPGPDDDVISGTGAAGMGMGGPPGVGGAMGQPQNGAPPGGEKAPKGEPVGGGDFFPFDAGRPGAGHFGKGEPCKPGETAASSGCIPAKKPEGEGKPAAAPEEPGAPKAGNQQVNPPEGSSPPSPEALEWLDDISKEQDVIEAREVLNTQPQSVDEFFDKASKKWDPERQKLHEKILAELPEGKGAITDKSLPEPGQRPKAVFIIGPTASGKSTVLSGKVGDKSKYVVINPDEIKEKLPGYDGKNAGLYQVESSYVVDHMLTDRAMQGRHNILFDVTGKTPKNVERALDQLERLGYDAEIHEMRLDPLEAAKRAVTRFRTKKRFVDPEFVVKGVDKNPPKTYELTKNHRIIKKYSSWDNNVPKGTPPKMLEEGSRNNG